MKDFLNFITTKSNTNFPRKPAQAEGSITLFYQIGGVTRVAILEDKNNHKGKLYAQEFIKVYGHDLENVATGKVIHGIYYLSKKTSHDQYKDEQDTSQFACDSLEI